MKSRRVLLPDRPLPAYSYVPGKFPHPVRDPGGHSYGEAPPVVEAAPGEAWRQCEPYLRGIDLFNHGYYWEAHEAWEAVWIACGRRGTQADFVKALIKLAAALVKGREGRAAGVARHARRARQLLESLIPPAAADAPAMLGLQLRDLIGLATALADHPEQFVNTADAKVVPRDDAQLQIDPTDL